MQEYTLQQLRQAAEGSAGKRGATETREALAQAEDTAGRLMGIMLVKKWDSLDDFCEARNIRFDKDGRVL